MLGIKSFITYEYRVELIMGEGVKLGFFRVSEMNVSSNISSRTETKLDDV